jgi:hypothetical protein
MQPKEADMAEFTLRDIMRELEEGWGEYVGQFNGLSPEAQTAFLEKQGYASFHDLIAHIVGWWEEGLWIITGILEEPGFTYEMRNTDEFNRELIEKYQTWDEVDLHLHFENVRKATLELAAELNEDALTNKHIRGWLFVNVIKHLEDHKIV